MDTNSTWNLNYSYIQCRLFYIFIYIQWYSVFFKQVVKKMFMFQKKITRSPQKYQNIEIKHSLPIAGYHSYQKGGGGECLVDQDK